MIQLSGMSQVLFHLTSVSSLYNILKTNKFYLTPVSGTSSEIELNKEKLYFMSNSRTANNSYTRMLGTNAVLLVLDGSKLSNRYKATALDYWGEDFRKVGGRGYEQEDRLVHDKPEIPNALSYITEVRLLYKEASELSRSNVDKISEILKVLKTRQVPIFVYDDASSFRTNNKSKSVPLIEFYKKVVTGKDRESVYPIDRRAGRKSDLFAFVELIKRPASQKSQLSEDAKYIIDRYFYSYPKDAVGHLKNYLHQARGASLPDENLRKDANSIILFLKKNGLTVDTLVNHLASKWLNKEKSSMRNLTVKQSLETAGAARLSLIGVPERWQNSPPSMNSFPSKFNAKAHHIWKECLSEYDYSLFTVAKQWEKIVEHYLDLCEEKAIAPFTDTPDPSDNNRIIQGLTTARKRLGQFLRESKLFDVVTCEYLGFTLISTIGKFEISPTCRIRGFGSVENLVKYLSSLGFVLRNTNEYVLKLNATTYLTVSKVTSASASLSYTIRLDTPAYHPRMRVDLVSDEDMKAYVEKDLWYPIVRTVRFYGLKSELF